MKTTKKRTLTLLLVLAMILSSFSAVAFAAGEAATGSVVIGSFETGTIEITASNADDSFALYKVIDVTYNEASNTVKYAFSSAAAAYASGLETPVTVKAYQEWGSDSHELKSFLAGFATYVRENSVDASKTVKASAGKATVSVSKNELGQYMVLGTGSETGAWIYQIMTATFKPDDSFNVNTKVDLASKATLPTLSKKIVSGDERLKKDSVATGDEFEYELTIDVPTYPVGAENKSFVVTDTLPSGLDYIGPQSVTVSDGTSSAEATGVTFAASGNNLSWNFTYDNIAAQKTITITYKVKANDPLVNNGNEIDGNTNNAALTYSDEPFGSADATYTISDSATVYTYGLQITKQDSKNPETKLAGVVFDVYKKGSTNKLKQITTDDNGVASLSGLDLGEYTLKEVKAATGYADPIDVDIDITLADADLNGKIDAEKQGESESIDGIKRVIITNSKGFFNIPTTGDSGTLFFTFAAMALMALAAALMLVMRRKQARR